MKGPSPKEFALLIGKKAGGAAPSEEEGDSTDGMAENDSASMEDSAVADLLQAIKGDDVPAAKQALKDFLDLVDTDSPADEE